QFGQALSASICGAGAAGEWAARAKSAAAGVAAASATIDVAAIYRRRPDGTKFVQSALTAACAEMRPIPIVRLSILRSETMSVATAPAPAAERLEFKTELKQLLDLIIHSLYTKKEIFLRELISNAADAIDKVRFEGLKHPELLQGDSDWKIRVIPDKEAGTLTASDNGIGMTREAIVSNLGT